MTAGKLHRNADGELLVTRWKRGHGEKTQVVSSARVTRRAVAALDVAGEIEVQIEFSGGGIGWCGLADQLVNTDLPDQSEDVAAPSPTRAERGTLDLTDNGWRIDGRVVKVLGRGVAEAIEAAGGPIEVEYAIENGQIVRAWPRGATFEASPDEKRAARDALIRAQTPPPPPPAPPVTGDFHNPYNFIPAPPRNAVTGPLGDGPPTSFERFDAAAISGRIAVTVTAATPLLIADAMTSTWANGHRTFGVRRGADGLPYIPPTSVRGMLRGAFEAVTNSRFGGFGKHPRDTFRSNAEQAQGIVPVRIEADGTGWKVVALPGTASITPTTIVRGPGSPDRPECPFAAWWPQYGQGGRVLVGGPGGDLPKPGQAITAVLERQKRPRPPLRIWRVVKAEAGHGARLKAGPNQIVVRGWAAITGKRFPDKHDERLFFHHEAERPELKCKCEALERDWRAVIESINLAHDFDGALKDGQLAYAVISAAPEGSFHVEALQPVMVSRRRYRSAPRDLIEPLGLTHAASRDELSAADRVFGWVADGRTAHGTVRGRLRVGPVASAPACPIRKHDPPLLLTTLNEPKPQNDRFYAASDRNGTPLQAGAERGTGFAPGGGLRGRKVYPHQGPLSDEHRGIGDPVASNSSVREWIAEGARFTFELTLDDVDRVSAGALLWLLSLGNAHHFKLGGGRPLGFGSVTLACNEVALCDGEAIRASLWSLERPRTLDGSQRDELVAEFRAAVQAAYGSEFASVPFIEAFLAAATGNVGSRVTELPTHYPRITPAFDPVAHPSYKWFAANEKPQGGKSALPALGSDHGLRRDGR